MPTEGSEMNLKEEFDPMVLDNAWRYMKSKFMEELRSMVKEEIQPVKDEIQSVKEKLLAGSGTRRNLKEDFEPMVLDNVRRDMKRRVTDTVQQDIKSPFEELRSMVKEEIQSFEEKLLAGGNRERSLKLKFLNEVCGPVQTGSELTGKNGEWLELALVDANEDTVTCGPESSAEVEIVLDASGKDDENNTTCEGRINQKPRLAKSATSATSFINLKDGIGKLIGLKLGHDSKRIRAHSCMLGARIVQNLRGPPIIVQAAWTAPFKVIDKRDKRFKKHHPPNLSSEVWRLEKIARKGEPCKLLEDLKIKTLKEFLFWLNVNREELRDILLVSVSDGIWNSIVAHAETCTIEDKDNKTFSHKSSTEPQMEVIYDVVGKLKGVVNKSHFVPSDNLSADEKDHARKLLIFVLKGSAFEELYKNSVDIEAYLQQEIPSDIDTSTNFSSQQCLNGSGPTLTENICGYQIMERDCQFQSIDPNNFFDSGPSHSLGSEEMGELRNPISGPFTDGGTPTDLVVGTTVQEAWTGPFKVIDKRTKDSDKHHPPNLSSEVWRLDQIANKGTPCKRLEDKNIKTLKEFLFWFNVDPEGLRQILCVRNGIWNTIVAHAETCIIKEKDNKTFSHKSYTEPQMEVIYDVVGKLKGVVNKSHFVPSDNLSADEKDHARKLLSFVLKGSAFEELYKNSVNIEAYLQQEIPSDIDTSTNFSSQQCLNGSSLAPLCNPASGPFPDPMFIDGGTPTDLDYEMHETSSLFSIPRGWSMNELYPVPPSPNPMLHYDPYYPRIGGDEVGVSHLGDDCYNGIGEGMPQFDSVAW